MVGLQRVAKAVVPLSKGVVYVLLAVMACLLGTTATIAIRRVYRKSIAFIVDQYWRYDPDTFRIFYAWSSLSLAYFMFRTPEAFLNSRGLELMHYAAPLWVWMMMFFTHWLLLTYVVLASMRFEFHVWRWSFKAPNNILIQWSVNAYGAVIWAFYVVLQDLSIGYMAWNASMERIAVIYSLWALTRTMLRRAPGCAGDPSCSVHAVPDHEGAIPAALRILRTARRSR